MGHSIDLYTGENFIFMYGLSGGTMVIRSYMSDMNLKGFLMSHGPHSSGVFRWK